ncbi:MAG TPA: Gfo/Idh/MocA family oxidoreductase, partial [Cyclobacteriaceae bacterium]|nr:Gfo/Idh/MocA family oxidoreductase [Cyclobacteriaceae bacterium]
MKRRSFIKKSMLTTAGLGITAPFIKSMAGNAEDNINVGVMGVNGRGDFLAGAFTSVPGVKVGFICDVDKRALEKGIHTVFESAGYKPLGFVDIRKMLEQKDLDALVIAAPDHWHAPAAIMGCNAGKHVYVEKPCCHNPAEGEILIKASKRSGMVVQMGNQRRSHPIYLKGIKELHDGVIGRVYFARGWYANDRASIGTGKTAEVPEWLDYDLWQGPAPRRPYRDNLIHYNWHWFWHWGTSETCNNGTHEMDVMRWGLNARYPVKVTSAGGRYRYKDDWETPDTQVVTYDFEDNKTAVWEGRSCNGINEDGDGRGVVFYGD